MEEKLILAKTPLPYPEFDRCAQVLDHRRLGQTRAINLPRLFRYVRDGKHIGQPSVDMWRDYPYWLMRYAIEIFREWDRRGYKDTMWPIVMEIYSSYPIEMQRRSERPPWLGRQDIHLSHQSNLIRREIFEEQRAIRDGRKRRTDTSPRHYRDAFPGVPYDLEYVWPSTK